MEYVKIERYKLEEIKEVYRLTKNIYKLGTTETAYYRMVTKTNKWIDEILNANSVPQPKQAVCDCGRKKHPKVSMCGYCREQPSSLYKEQTS